MSAISKFGQIGNRLIREGFKKAEQRKRELERQERQLKKKKKQ